MLFASVELFHSNTNHLMHYKYELYGKADSSCKLLIIQSFRSDTTSCEGFDCVCL